MEYAYDYTPKQPCYKSVEINEGTFTKWSKENMYRTNYTTTFTDKPLNPKNKAIPGYQGFVPGYVAENCHGKTYSKITKDRFQNAGLRKNTTGLSTTGYNFAQYNFGDQTLDSASQKYGKQTLQNNHPAIAQQSKDWCSQTKNTYGNPSSQVNPTFRNTAQITLCPQSLTSGFETNYTTGDTKGWHFHPVLDGNSYFAFIQYQIGNRSTTEYRRYYNGAQEFHRKSKLYKLRKLGSKAIPAQ